MKTIKTILFLTSFYMVCFQTGKLAFGTRPMPYYHYWKLVEDISKDVSTPEKKSQVVRVLLAIVKRDAVDVHLREFAVQKLGELGASEAKDTLKGLAESLTWTDTTRQLKRQATLAYWMIRVAEEETTEAQEDLLIQLLWGNHLPPHADVVLWWAAEELANRGVSKALPEIAAAVRYRDSSARGEEFIKLCSVKIELLNSSPSRLEALKQALASTDALIGYELKMWAIGELGKLGSQEALEVLINYALELQGTFYDEAGRLKILPTDPAWLELPNAGSYYRRIVGVLRDKGMSDSQILAVGLNPYRYFSG